MKNYIIFFLVSILSVIKLEAQEEDVYGKISILKSDRFITLDAQIHNDGPLIRDEMKYVFLALKKSKEGNYSNNKQTGEFIINPKEEKKVSTIKVNLSEDEELKVYLFVRYKEKLISKDSLFILPKIKRQSNAQKNQEINFSLKGIVLDEAITKTGKDFFDFFYQDYLLSGKKYPFIIKIKEKPAMGRSSIIYVEVGDSKIHEFYSRPEEEYLKNNVKTVLKRIYLYNKRRSRLYKNSNL
ncbi:curli production assembly/transport protein CsgE [Tenacibaculum aquimarinum]|uniref:curli production assembly/transport protein CsgE n=1 Tax=Tenacibaculum aquimarinum TaxID=2910675 RepID=UPI001F0B3031|nr:curli production assembly/transport protein CsgE [Tenacibaculum aquimarinum]MCH3882800.1 curli production assembly/transport protein CsgE [Tenacibaculum aquimarinum]